MTLDLLKLPRPEGSLLTPVHPTEENKKGGVVWLFKCKCGNSKMATAHDYLIGDVKSCGCLLKSSKERRERYKARLANGETMSEIAKAEGITRQRVYQIISGKKS